MAEGENHMVLKEEFYDNATITRGYEIQENKQLYIIKIQIPKELIQEIESSKDPLLEAKKQLTKWDTDHSLTEKLAELNNEKIQNFNAITSVDTTLESAFIHQKQIAIQYTKKNKQIVTNTNKSNDENLDYKQIQDKTSKDVRKMDTKSSFEQRTLVKKQGQDTKSDQSKKVIGVIISIIFLLAMAILVSRKSNINKENS